MLFHLQLTINRAISWFKDGCPGDWDSHNADYYGLHDHEVGCNAINGDLNVGTPYEGYSNIEMKNFDKFGVKIQMFKSAADSSSFCSPLDFLSEIVGDGCHALPVSGEPVYYKVLKK